MTKTRILFTHNTAMWYRIPFFNELARIYDLDLVFTHADVIKEIYDDEFENSIKNLENVNYTILNNTFGFARGLLSKAGQEHDITIGGSWDTPQELIESIVLFTITKIKKEPFIIWREDWDWERNYGLKEKLLNVITKYLCNHADAILVPGTLHKDYFHEKMGVSEENIFIMPNVSNIEGKCDITQKDHDVKKILYVGRLIKRKGVKYLLEAFEDLNLSNCELIIVGSGSEESNLKRYVCDNNIENVFFKGKIDNEELEEYYNESNVVVVPSINEGMGDPWVFVLNEAMYYYNPIIATTAVGAAPDMIKGNGFIVNEKDSKALSKVIKDILTDENLEKDMQIRSKEIIDNEFQYSNMVNAFNNAIKKVKKNS